MFFLLSKLLSVLIEPFFWVFILIILAWLFRYRGYQKFFLRLSVIVLIIFSNSALFLGFVSLWEEEGQKIEDVEYHDIAVVLGGMAEYNKDLDRLSIRRGGDRIWQAMNLYFEGKVGKILISGDNGFVTSSGLHEATQFRDILIKNGIPPTDILVDSLSKNTYQNAVESKKVIDELNKDVSVLLVTSGIHMKRSKACFVKQGFSDLSTFSTDHYVGQKMGFSHYFIPNASVLVSWKSLLHEWVGYITYALKGYL